jgi:uncharacterized protein YbbK (DUF523 family)/uncharacterized protein YbgA (DUF1722 family)
MVMFQAQDLPVRVGISRCLLGERVRYDGGHKHDPFLTETLARYVEFVPVCPEVEVGMGTPREPIRLVELGGEIRLRGVRSDIDHTAEMRRYARRRARELAACNLSGFVLKKDSPSCGMEHVKVWQGTGAGADDSSRRSTAAARSRGGTARGRAVRRGVGLFALALLEALPNLPVEDEGRLSEPSLRENWVERVFAYHRLRALWLTRWNIDDLSAFHRANKFVLLAHGSGAYDRLSHLLVQAESTGRSQLRARYEKQFMAGLRKIATPTGHAKVLQRMAAMCSDLLEQAERQELRAAIDAYRRSLVPLSVPLALINHHVQRLDIEGLCGQTYLNPHPNELMLRNHV